ncbi:MAG TPA: Flp family type IVb pilin [Anaerolineaceae bacterium]|nr:Flp family type IVb pilin [Anaerolineaceae bacterium]
MLNQFLLWLKTFVVKDEEGQTLVEYALIIALIAIVLIVALTALGGGITNTFNNIVDTLP